VAARAGQSMLQDSINISNSNSQFGERVGEVKNAGIAHTYEKFLGRRQIIQQSRERKEQLLKMSHQ